MKLNSIVNNIVKSTKGAFYKTKFKCIQHSPEILAAVGIIGVVGAGVMACFETTKISEITDAHKSTMDDIHEMTNRIEVGAELDNYSLDDAKKDTAITYVQTGWKLVKLYAPSVILGTLSIGALVGSNRILRKRNAALAAAYAAVDSSFKKYRQNVVEKYGKEVDQEMRYGLKKEKVEVEKEIDGKTKKVKETVETAAVGYSDYAKFFDSSCAGWEKNPEYNLMFLKTVQNNANAKLRSKGYLFLNEVYDALGIERTQAGQIVGWFYDEKNPIGDNYVDFFMYDLNADPENADAKQRFVNGIENVILLDFNVDGPILDKI